MTRSLYGPRPNPYYVYAMDYRRNSAGIRVLHALCDALLKSGFEAYVFGNVLNPALMTPRLTEEVITRHREYGLEPIVVYPEVVGSNPLAGNVVVRYLLNWPGFLTVHGATGYGRDDILYSYTKDLLMPGEPEDQTLFMPPFDLSVFRPSDDPGKRIAGKICYYQGRARQVPIDQALLAPDSVEITTTYPASWEAMADLFQTCEYFYCTESSALTGEAALCGCLSVILPNEWVPSLIGQSETQGLGLAWGLAPEQLQWARDTLPLFRERMLQQEAEFWKSLDAFIEVTQQASRDYQARPRIDEVSRWLAPRVLSAQQQAQVNARIEQYPVPSLQWLIIDSEGAAQPLQRSVDSINALLGVIDTDIRIHLLSIEPGSVLPQANLLAQHLAADAGVEQVNEVLMASSAQWFMLLQAGDELTVGGFVAMALELAGTGDRRALYTDEVMRMEDGSKGLLLRPDLNLDLLLSCPASMARHWLFHRETWQAMGGFDQQFAQAFELEYILRLIETRGFEGLGHVSEPLLVGDVLSLHDQPQVRAVIERHLHTRGFERATVASSRPGCYELDFAHSATPMVSIVILVDGQLAKVQRCTDSLLENTPYAHYELLLLDRANQDPQVAGWLSGIEQLGIAHLRVLRYAAEAPQALLNHAASQARGEFLVFLDCTTGVLHKDWLQQLLNHGQRPEVGCVGPMLIGGDGKISRAGLVLGLGGAVGAPGQGMAADSVGYMQRLQVDQNFSALSGQCLMVRQEHFIAVGGFDEQLHPWSNVDLCLKIQQAGYLNVWTPRVKLLLSGQEAEKPSAEQTDRLYERWLPVLARDPAYNRHFSLIADAAFKPAESVLSWRPLAAWKPVPTVLVHPVEKLACGWQRIIAPLDAMRAAGSVEGVHAPRVLSAVELERFDPDVIVLQHQLTLQSLVDMQRMKRFSRAFKVYDLDAYLPDQPAFARLRQPPEQVVEMMGQAFACMDRVVVSNPVLAQVFEGFNPDIRILPTRLDPLRWAGLSSARRCSVKPRIGWVGGIPQAGDLRVISEAIKALADEVEWVVLGSCPDDLRPYMHEVRKGVPLASYPTALASLNLDLAVVPLEANLINRCSSHQRLLEYAMCGVPVICSDLEPFQGDLPVTRVKNVHEDWMRYLRAYLSDLDSVALLGDAFRAQVQRDWMLDEASVAAWRSVWLPD
ncbi:glycosyltransferase [Pseudomonas sp. MWU16-30317]|uniref:glycosyltransferase n=1 Tax=Pseudomonas sp. MWU16-30317 TaxID=2878095 RepID=UPI001CFA291D